MVLLLPLSPLLLTAARKFLQAVPLLTCLSWLFITFRIRSQLLNMPRKKCKRSFLALAPVFLGGTVPYTFFPLSPPPASSSNSLPFSAPPPSPTLDNKHFTWALASVPWEDCPKCHRFAHGSLPCAPLHHITVTGFCVAHVSATLLD